LALLSALYSVLLLSRRFVYSYIKRPKKLPAKVISVGNLTLGGTGKTPATISIAMEAKRHGLKPCILTRGYRGSVSGPCFVTKGKGALVNPYEAGDEAFLMAERLDGIPVIKDRDRYRAGMFMFENPLEEESPTETLFILDDGFQHWALQRDIDIVLIDSTYPLESQHLFPKGNLREPLNALERADIIVLTKTELAESSVISENMAIIKKYNPSAPVYRASYRASALVNALGRSGDPQRLKGKKVYAFAGIGNPSHFRSLLISLGADVVKFKRFRDHYFYKQKDLEEMRREASGLEIITTEKDMVKLRELRLPENIHALRIEFSVEKEFYNQLFWRLRC